MVSRLLDNINTLHVDQIEELGLDAILCTRIMAETLANLYWRAHVDGNDVEFVLAPPREDHSFQSEGRHSTPITSHILGEHVIWILDFDCCKDMPLDETGVEQAVVAFYKNDPFYPRPGHDNIQDQTLWREFKDGFLEASEAMLDQGSLEARLPVLWVDSVEQRAPRG
ncbi:hypothetical protein MMC12_008267 [Toensbergia leucococca]|nr:hypothetical protein [Toensbergia leucococca]